MKKCSGCNSIKPLSSFYSNKSRADGHSHRCIECERARHKAYLQTDKGRSTQRERSKREYRRGGKKRQQARSKTPEVMLANRARNLRYKEARGAYARSERGRECARRASYAWAARNPEKRAAHIAVNAAIRAGLMVRSPCEVCGSKAQAHHEDYSRPLEVSWLCQKHHAEHHFMERLNGRDTRTQTIGFN